MTYQYVIVGAGTAGCVLADRLSADPANEVLLIEAGPADHSPMFSVPKGFAFTLANPQFSYTYPTAPFGPYGQQEYWMRGKVLGGSSSVNGMVYNRGSQADYDAIEALGNPGWGWSEILRIFKTIENHELGASDMRGAGGPVGITVSKPYEEALELLKDSAGVVGLKNVEDVNATDEERIGNTPGNIHKGVRQSASRVFLRPAMKRPNLTVRTRTQVTSLIFEGERAVGVKATANGAEVEFRADREVILSMGSIATPQLLQLSGIGPSAVLKEVGVGVRVDSPRVGEGIREHRCIPLEVRLNRNIGYNRLLATGGGQARQALRYLATRKGPIATPAYDLIAFLRTSETSERPDAQLLLGPFSRGPGATSSGLERQPGINILGFALRPTTRSRVHITTTDPTAAPRIEAHYLETDHDRDISVAMFRKMRELLASEPIASVVANENIPGAVVDDDEHILKSGFLNGGTGYHASGACAMGPEATDAIDSRLRVRGVDGLRVVDVSILPAMVAGNLNGPMMAMAWRAAELILEDR